MRVIANAVSLDKLSPDLCLRQSQSAEEAAERRSDISEHLITTNNNTNQKWIDIIEAIAIYVA